MTLQGVSILDGMSKMETVSDAHCGACGLLAYCSTVPFQHPGVALNEPLSNDYYRGSHFQLGSILS